MPVNDNSSLLNGNQNNYGSLIRTSNGSTKTVIYCVHGKPSSGCCKVLQSEVLTSGGNIPVETIGSNAKEDVRTTELIKKHCHRNQDSGIDKKARNRLLIASTLCLLFMIAEIVGGFLSNSLAIASDAAHLLTDFASFMISLFSLWVASRPSTRKMHFGWYRAEVIGALTSVLMIWVVTAILVYLAFLRLVNGDFEIESKIMLITSGLGVVVNLIMGFSLHDHGHGHSHSGGHSHVDDHKHSMENGLMHSTEQKQNINVRAALIHVIGDFLQSLGVFIAALVIFFKEDWKIVDPICTFLFSILVVITTFNIIKDVLVVLMEGAPRGTDFKEVMDTLMATPGVKRIHNLRIWALSLDKVAMSAHVAIRNEWGVLPGYSSAMGSCLISNKLFNSQDKMWGCVIFTCIHILQITHALWEADARCPSICTCKLEHLTETPIYRFMQNNKNRPIHGEIQSIELNDVIPEDSLETEIFQDKPIVRSATCILQTGTVPTDLIRSLPNDIETLTLIQGYKSGNKTVKLSDLLQFKQLLSVELLGPQLFHNGTNSHLLCEIDKPLPNLKYLSFERILIKNSKSQLQNFVKEVNEDQMTFEYTHKFDSNAHVLTLVQEGTNEDILPYEKYKQHEEYARVPLFFGFKHLNLLRIRSCELNVVHWEMFDGLQNLEYLILEENNLHFIPPFAFYGTPNLKTLSLSHNNLLDIQITDLAGLLELAYLDLSFNNFSQLSELSLPPFPNLKLANFANNPITVIFPNTFEVMNTTDSLIIGSDDMELVLLKNSFLGLDLLKILTLKNLHIKLFKRELLTGMPNLKELVLTGNITEIEFDSFLEVYKLQKLILSKCNIRNISMDSFVGLEKLEYLDLSKNQLEYLPPNVFDELTFLKELYLNDNKLTELPHDIFSRIHPKLLRLNKNPWHCSCQMSEWKPMIINKLKQKSIKHCDRSLDKGISCNLDNHIYFKYVYDNKIAPKCVSPLQYENWSVFQVMRKLLKCKEYRPKLRKHHRKLTHHITPNNNSAILDIHKDEAKKFVSVKELHKIKYLEKMNKTLHKINATFSKPTETQENVSNNSENNSLVPEIHSLEELNTSNSHEISSNQIGGKMFNATHNHIHKRKRIHRIRKHRKPAVAHFSTNHI